jgi:uroporphyrinogen decarboxylase
MSPKFHKMIQGSPYRIPFLIGAYAGLEITGASVKDSVTNPIDQAEAVLALNNRLQTQFLLTAMDLSAEAEAFGCQVRMSDDEIPTVIGRMVTDEVGIDRLAIPAVGEKRTSVHLKTAEILINQATDLPVFAGVIGPFSLAGRILGESDALKLSLMNPPLLEKLLIKVTRFLIAYLMTFRTIGVDGVIMAEPAAGLLSPRGLSQFSSRFIKQIMDETQNEGFSLIYHNCGAKLAHLPNILETGVGILHFSAPMDIKKALEQVDKNIILAGNLDPISVFFSGTVTEVMAHTQSLLNLTSGFTNFIISSGCDIPPHTPIRNLEAFYSTVKDFSK